MDEDEVIRIRKEKIKLFIKEKFNWIIYFFLAIIVFLAIRIRTRNLPGLRDITTGGWTLGPDLDPFLFLRWSKAIVSNGVLFTVDKMRYSPLGLSTSKEYLLHPYMMAWFHKIAVIFGSTSVTQSAVIYPVFFFAITVIAFFFLSRIIFIDKLGYRKASLIALISSFFLTVFPALLPRTIAGIPEKESAAFFFMFAALYFFISSWKSKHKYGKYIRSVLAGVFTAGMANVWGGHIFLIITISISSLIYFILGNMDREKSYLYSVWMFTSFILMASLSERHSISNIVSSVSGTLAIFTFFVILFSFLIYKTKLKRYIVKGRLVNIPRPVLSIILTIIILSIVVFTFFGPSFISSQVSSIYNGLTKPATSRLIQTVAENRQPYFPEWSNSFGPNVKGFPLSFWLFFLGSIYLVYNMFSNFKLKRRLKIVLGYSFFLVAIVFSRYKANSFFNGENTQSLILYFSGLIIFVFIFSYYYTRLAKEKNLSLLKNIDFGLIILMVLFLLGIISSRASVRTIMILVPAASIIISYLIVSSFSRVNASKSSKKKIGWFFVIIIIIAAIFSGFELYNISTATATGFVPSQYTQQWQKAMSWVRDNTPQDAVFGHWWDYGYWVQSIGERATVLDGGNAISYWNHFMGRYALTGSDNKEALEFLYAHNTTHFLIDSTDVGKYTAFSSIGSNESYDRRSWIGTYLRDNSQVFNTKNSTVYVYRGGISLDENIVYNGTFLPGVGNGILGNSNLAGLGGIRLEIDNDGEILQPQGVFIYQGRQSIIPLRYAFYNNEFIDFGSGIESGIYLMPSITQTHGNSVQIEENGALLYLSKRVVKSQFARLYLYNEKNPNFNLVHSEDDFIVSALKSQGQNIGDIVYFKGFRGPIRIWEINYPENIEFKDKFLKTSPSGI